MANFARYYWVEASGNNKIEFTADTKKNWHSVVARGMDAEGTALESVTIVVKEGRGTLQSRANHTYEVIFQDEKFTAENLVPHQDAEQESVDGTGIEFLSDRDPPPPPPGTAKITKKFRVEDVVNF